MDADTHLKNVFVCVQVPPCACFILLVMVEIFLMPPLPGPAGCFRVSRMEGGGNISMCGGRTVQTFTVCRLYNPYLLVAGSAPWNRALPTMLMLMPPSRVGTLMLSSQTAVLNVYYYRLCVQGRRLSVDLIDDMAVELGFFFFFFFFSVTVGRDLCEGTTIDAHTQSLHIHTSSIQYSTVGAVRLLYLFDLPSNSKLLLQQENATIRNMMLKKIAQKHY